MQFKNVVGNEIVKKQLLQMANNNRLPHALMLSASEGTGGLPMAFALTQYVYCENKTEIDSCGECDNCIKIKKLTHPDLHLSFPVVKLKTDIPISTDFYAEFRNIFSQQAYTSTFDWIKTLSKENKQGNITARECREVIKKLNLRSFEGGYKTLIMWRPEFLGNEGNILLKLIEEPPAKTILIFVCEQYDKILATIQSRTQLIQLHNLSNLEIQNALVQNENIESETALKIARLSNGNYYEAIQQSKNFNNPYNEWMRNWFNALYTNNHVNITQWAQGMNDYTRDEQKQFLENCISLLENQIRVQLLPADKVYLPQEELDFIQKLIKNKVTPTKINTITQIWNDAIYHIERNANAKILFHAVSLKTREVLVGK